MKLPPAKSGLSPGRTRDSHSASSQISLSTSLSRRMRTNGSLKGAQASPMFPSGGRSGGGGGKRKGSAFENPEPSSPKVTCIGQVRVGKRHGRKKISNQGSGRDSSLGAKRGFGSGEEATVVNEQCCVNRNVKWVTICEGLRTLGADFNCLFPCRSGLCMTGKNDSEEDRPGGGFCGAVFARWVVEDGISRGKKIEFVVGEEEDDGATEIGGDDAPEIEGRSSRRNGLEHVKFSEIQNLGGDGGRVSICIPPKNALLLMRCRSDPVKMAALANKCFEASLTPHEEEEEENDTREEEETEIRKEEEDRDNSKQAEAVIVLEDNNKTADADEEEHDEEKEIAVLEKMDEEEEEEVEEEVEEVEVETMTRTSEEEDQMEETQNLEDEQEPQKENDEAMDQKEEPELRNDTTLIENPTDKPSLPDCLLLMMCEPKLSMEVSKETWVCSTDFIRWVPGGRPKRHPKKSAAGDDPDKKKRSTTTNMDCVILVEQENKGEENRIKKTHEEKVVKFQPSRSSCHYPSMAMAIEKKLVGAKGFEPFVLTRCKSEPMRTVSSKLLPQDIQL